MKLAILTLLCACTTLGPMPATTGVSAVPIGHPGADVQAGAVPVFFLSQAAQGEAQADLARQLGVLLEPDRWLKLPGLVIGARMFGNGPEDTLGEPYVGYRTKLTDRASIGGGAYGTAKRSTAKLASYHATRIGGEAAIDGNLLQATSWLSIHAQAAVSVTRIMASGNYCVGNEGTAIDCDTSDPTTNVMIAGNQTGVYPAATGTVSVAGARSQGFFRSATVSMLGSVGTMPLLRNGVKTGTDTYAGLGLMLTLGLGD
jgi:hypothetical protein